MDRSVSGFHLPAWDYINYYILKAYENPFQEVCNALIPSLCLFACDNDGETPVTTLKLDPAECTINWNFSCLKGAKLASTWDNNVNGYTETQTVKACIMNIGQTGPAECMTEWYNGDCIARPILAF